MVLYASGAAAGAPPQDCTGCRRRRSVNTVPGGWLLRKRVPGGNGHGFRLLRGGGPYKQAKEVGTGSGTLPRKEKVCLEAREHVPSKTRTACSLFHPSQTSGQKCAFPVSLGSRSDRRSCSVFRNPPLFRWRRRPSSTFPEKKGLPLCNGSLETVFKVVFQARGNSTSNNLVHNRCTCNAGHQS